MYLFCWCYPEKNCMNRNKKKISNLWLSKPKWNIYICTKKASTQASPLGVSFFFFLVHTALFTQLALILRVKLAAILQLSQYCTFDGDSISTMITEPGQPVISSSPTLGTIHPKDKFCNHWSTITISTYARWWQYNNASYSVNDSAFFTTD